MDAIVPPEVTAELTQILSNLVQGDNQLRSNAEKAVNDRLAQTPELYLLALAQFSTNADTIVMRSFSLVLLRRLLFRASPTTHLSLYDHLSSQSLATLERILLHSLLHEPSPVVRRKTVDTVADLANNAMQRGRPWHALQAQTFTMVDNHDSITREAAYRILSQSPNLIIDLRLDVVLSTLQKGLEDAESIEVRLAALRAAVQYLSTLDVAQQAQALSLLYPMLNTLPSLPHTHLPAFLSALTPLTSSHPTLFEPHLHALLSFLPPLIVPAVDAGPTPTVARPNPAGGSSFVFPPPSQNGNGKSKATVEEHESDHEEEEVRKAALEFMVSLTEARPSMVKRVDGWTAVMVRGCLEGMGEIPEDETDIWLEADPLEDPTDDTYPHVYEQAIDRIACALGGKAALPPAFQYIPAMLASYDWRLRHAGLMAIAAIAEGTSKVMQHELGKVIDLVIPMFNDQHPRVRYAACQCIGQLCTDLEEVIQEKFHQQIFGALIPTLEAREPRVASHAAAALINFCEGVERETLLPYLDPIVERLLKLLNPGSGAQPQRYVQEQAITTLAMVADASEATFAKHYSAIMPLLLNVLQNANSTEYAKLRVRAMECAGLIAIAVGRDVFRQDASRFIELLMRIQNSPVDPNDTMLGHYLIATWAKVCQAMGQEFEPYLPVVMPPLLIAASAKADLSIYDEDEEHEEQEGWETIRMDGQQVGIKTSALEEKCQAFETLVIYVSTLGVRFAPYLSQTLELVLPSLRFYFHEGVREACAMLIPMLVSCGKASSTLTDQMVSATFSQLVNCIASETDCSFLASLYKCFTDGMRALGGPSMLAPQIHDGIMEATKHQLQGIADKRKARAARPASDLADEKDDLMLLEEMEDFALEDMAKMLIAFDSNHQLLIAVSSVRDLGLQLGQWESEDEGGAEG
ncbi:ARM repeat-containing protein [Laetiporus sulphureus 93-53]|uniref:ARM repeat-containing protein n=1 Tax=Laetiporus sulphureus 93-53 TaxID=1314785 RepID=A0A165B1N5_9APHY|nr:ARM repeat-containing protein [Laetiporus sulphureus 93-53]KZT00064.1 ARM repeat-containing protein [Laetiporus sulphureus 93-53]